MFLPHPRVKVSIVGSLRDREVAYSASDRRGSNFESCVWRTVSSQSSHHPQEVLLAQFSLYVHKGGQKPDLFHFLPPPSLISQWTRLYCTMYLVHTMQAYPPNTGSMMDQCRSPLLVQCRSIVFDAGPILKQDWVIVPCLLWLPYRWSFMPDDTLLWNNVGPPSATLG